MIEEQECPICYEKIEWDIDSKVEYITCVHCGYRIRTPNAMPLLPGTEIGDYQIISLLGIGGMGEIYLAEQKSMLREVALKVLNKTPFEDTSYLVRFYNEVRMLAQIEHPNIVSAIEAGYDNGICFFSMRYIRGSDIERLIKEKKYYTEIEAFKIIKDVALALKYVWDKYKLIHRDIKPANIMLTESGTVKLMDLGIAKSVKGELKSDLTVDGFMVGSPLYVSPEQAIGRKDIDFHTDIYSLGATFFHMITGKLPYDKENSMEIIASHLRDPVPNPRKYRRELSSTTVSFVKKMMQKKSKNRFATWQSVIDAIDQAVINIKQKKSNAILHPHSIKYRKAKINTKKKGRYFRKDIAKRRLRKSAFGRAIYNAPVRIFFIIFLLVIGVSVIAFKINKKIKRQRVLAIAYTQAHDFILLNSLNDETYKIAEAKLKYIESFNIPEYMVLVEKLRRELEKKYKTAIFKVRTKEINLDLKKLKMNVRHFVKTKRIQEAISILEKYETNGKFSEELEYYISPTKHKLQLALENENDKENE